MDCSIFHAGGLSLRNLNTLIKIMNVGYEGELKRLESKRVSGKFFSLFIEEGLVYGLPSRGGTDGFSNVGGKKS